MLIDDADLLVKHLPVVVVHALSFGFSRRKLLRSQGSVMAWHHLHLEVVLAILPVQVHKEGCLGSVPAS